jgi:hypothetical protein
MINLSPSLGSEGVRSLTFTAYLQDYPSISITKTFTATVICEVLTVSWGDPPANMTVEVGVTTGGTA